MNSDNNKIEKCNGVAEVEGHEQEMHSIQQAQLGKHSKNNSSDDICNRKDINNNNIIINYNQHHTCQQEKQQYHKRRLHLFNHHEEEPVVEPLCNSISNNSNVSNKLTEVGVQENENEVDEINSNYSQELEEQQKSKLKRNHFDTRPKVLQPRNVNHRNKNHRNANSIEDDNVEEISAKAVITVKDSNYDNNIEDHTDVSISHEAESDSVCVTLESGNADELVESLKQRLLPP